MLESLDALVAYSAAVHEQKVSSQVSLFGEAGADLPEPRLANTPDWDAPERVLPREGRAEQGDSACRVEVPAPGLAVIQIP